MLWHISRSPGIYMYIIYEWEKVTCNVFEKSSNKLFCVYMQNYDKLLAMCFIPWVKKNFVCAHKNIVKLLPM